jgi:NADH-quinone oxidoreductase subunit N
LSAVPFHFWCPDVFEGAPAEVNAFLSVASKAAALALLVRVAVGFGTVPDTSPRDDVAAATTSPGLYAVADSVAAPPAPHDATADAKPATTATASSAQRLAALAPARNFMGQLIAFLAVITCTFGNLAAYGQTNIKRLFAYSTIAHAGYMMMAVPALLTLAGYDAAAAERAAAGLGVYIFCYLFMNLGVFAVIAFLRNAMRSENIADYSGLIRRCPLLVVCFSLMLFSLVGLPPLSGFIGKLAVFASLMEGYEVSAAHGQPATYLLVVLLIGGVNTAISLFYYLRVAKVMTIDPEKPDRPPLEFSNAFLQGLYVGVVTFPTVALILSWDWLYAWTVAAASQLLG